MSDRTIQGELDKVLNTPAATLPGASASQAMSVATGNAAGARGSAGDGDAAPANAGQSALADSVAQAAAQLSQIQTAIQTQLDLLTANTQALSENTSAKSAGSTAASAASSVASTVLGGGLLGSVVSGLMSLFGGDDSSTATATTKFALPQSIQLQAGTDGSSVSGADYGQNDVPRSTSSSSANSQQITVNVSALDSQSFLDHSTDIANAVRKAMLESSSLNDVISEM